MFRGGQAIAPRPGRLMREVRVSVKLRAGDRRPTVHRLSGAKFPPPPGTAE
jgi:hypothetical protein